MDKLQPGYTISNKYGTRKVLAVLPGVVMTDTAYIDNHWYTIDQLKSNGYELTLNDEPEEVDYIYVRERLLEALGGESEESYIDDKAKHLLDNLITVVAEFISLERKDND